MGMTGVVAGAALAVPIVAGVAMAGAALRKPVVRRIVVILPFSVTLVCCRPGVRSPSICLRIELWQRDVR